MRDDRDPAQAEAHVFSEIYASHIKARASTPFARDMAKLAVNAFRETQSPDQSIIAK